VLSGHFLHIWGSSRSMRKRLRSFPPSEGTLRKQEYASNDVSIIFTVMSIIIYNYNHVWERAVSRSTEFRSRVSPPCFLDSASVIACVVHPIHHRERSRSEPNRVTVYRPSTEINSIIRVPSKRIFAGGTCWRNIFAGLSLARASANARIRIRVTGARRRKSLRLPDKAWRLEFIAVDALVERFAPILAHFPCDRATCNARVEENDWREDSRESSGKEQRKDQKIYVCMCARARVCVSASECVRMSSSATRRTRTAPLCREY